ncbi:hypothetical protein F2Q70_00003801 [Brassica cretica]|uniref:Uncharacterized protein n=1 Tax=Brassica cretica TaxID=69181 RepID=A0A8S9IYA8_BRACR|nr:hypothetical protein F2Q68_00021069 [Brassica cretica]KAF2574392.1 hypothetical protein F2Q70_00003801 [Brassica cretica]
MEGLGSVRCSAVSLGITGRRLELPEIAASTSVPQIHANLVTVRRSTPQPCSSRRDKVVTADHVKRNQSPEKFARDLRSFADHRRALHAPPSKIVSASTRRCPPLASSAAVAVGDCSGKPSPPVTGQLG